MSLLASPQKRCCSEHLKTSNLSFSCLVIFCPPRTEISGSSMNMFNKHPQSLLRSPNNWYSEPRSQIKWWARWACDEVSIWNGAWNISGNGIRWGKLCSAGALSGTVLCVITKNNLANCRVWGNETSKENTWRKSWGPLTLLLIVVVPVNWRKFLLAGVYHLCPEATCKGQKERRSSVPLVDLSSCSPLPAC